MAIRAAHSISVLSLGLITGGCASVPTGRVGVEWTPLRGTEPKTLDEGLHLVSPFARVYRVDLARAGRRGFPGRPREQRSRHQIDELDSLSADRLGGLPAHHANGRGLLYGADCPLCTFQRTQNRRPIFARGNLFIQARADRAGNSRRGRAEARRQARRGRCHSDPRGSPAGSGASARFRPSSRRSRRRWKCSSCSNAPSRRPCASTSRREG